MFGIDPNTLLTIGLAAAGLFLNPILSRLGIKLPSPFREPDVKPAPPPAPVTPAVPTPAPLVPGLTPDAILQLLWKKLEEWLRTKFTEANAEAIAKLLDKKEAGQ